MKYLRIMLLLFIVTGCERIWTVEQIIQNSTRHYIEIETYIEGKEREIISIAPGENYARIRSIERRDVADIFILRSWIDSANIIFDNKKIIIQSCNNSSLMSCPDVDRNILRLTEYEKEDKGDRSISYTYTITQEDYENAVPIEQ